MIAVVGVGNPLCGDDAVGPRVADYVRDALSDPRIRVGISPSEPICLFEAIEGCGSAVVIDACRGGEPGEVHAVPFKWLDQGKGAAGSSVMATTPSSHGFGLDHALALGYSLGVLPEKLLVIAVSGCRFELGESMSPAVRLGAIRAAWHVIDIVNGWLDENDEKTAILEQRICV